MNPDQQLIDYISKNLNLGYDQQSISQTLLSSGYSQEQVNAAFDYLYAQSHYGAQQPANYTPGGHIAGKQIALFAMIGVGLVLAVISGLLLFADSGTPSNEFSVNPNDDTTQTTLRDTEQSDDDPSNDDSEEVIEDDVRDPSEDTTPNPVQTTPDEPSTESEAVSLSDSGELTRIEIDKKVKEIAATNPDEALDLCSQILARAGRSNCITIVALESKQPTICETHTDIYLKDTCYMNFAIEEVGSIQAVCSNVQDQFKQRSCVLLYNNFAESAVQEQQEVQELTLAQQEQIKDSQTSDEPILG